MTSLDDRFTWQPDRIDAPPARDLGEMLRLRPCGGSVAAPGTSGGRLRGREVVDSRHFGTVRHGNGEGTRFSVEDPGYAVD